MFDEQVDPAVESALQRAVEEVEAFCPGALDDLLMLELLLSEPDETVLRALGTRTRTLLREVEKERASGPAPSSDEFGLPAAEDIVRFAASEAAELGGWGAEIRGIHVMLALFAFHGSRGEALLRKCGLDWRPLRSVTRRLGSW